MPTTVVQAEFNERLWRNYVAEHNPKLREQIIVQYAPLVKYVVGRMAIALPKILSYEDVLSYGSMGLVQAVDRYDPSVGVKFETYAIPRIRGTNRRSIVVSLQCAHWQGNRSGEWNLQMQTATGEISFSHKYCQMIQRHDGYAYALQPKGGAGCPNEDCT